MNILKGNLSFNINVVKVDMLPQNEWTDLGVNGLGRSWKSTGICIRYREYNTLAKYISTGNCTKYRKL